MAYLLTGLLVQPAKKAGIEVPDDIEDYDAKKYPYWHVFVTVQLGASLPYPSAGWDNAEVVASIPANKIRSVTLNDLKLAGLALGNSSMYA